MNGYLVPANSKKGTLIFNLFREVDLIILCTGVGISFLLLAFFNTTDFWLACLFMLPAMFCIFLVIPIPNYHNVMCGIISMYNFYSRRRRYVWKGWCSYENISREDDK